MLLKQPMTTIATNDNALQIPAGMACGRQSDQAGTIDGNQGALV
ncbi:hypothetical protein [Paenibacillus harenae]|nr:hypothetical protein [Paenibacillus harenae]